MYIHGKWIKLLKINGITFLNTTFNKITKELMFSQTMKE